MTPRNAVRLLATLLLPALCGCSLTASIESTLPQESALHDPGFGNTAVVSAQKDLTAESQYRIQASAGAITNKVADRTPAGFLVMTSTQGALFGDSVTSSMQMLHSVPAQ